MRSRRLETLRDLGVDSAAVRRPIGALSGGQRQSIAVARAVHFGARILILDEPRSALGVKQAEIVLGYVRQAKERRIGVISITHNVQHAYLIGDTFVVLFLGRQLGTFKKRDLTETQLLGLMAGKIDVAGWGLGPIQLRRSRPVLPLQEKLPFYTVKALQLPSESLDQS
jgi:simple sugar transport system ATP-binding protein